VEVIDALIKINSYLVKQTEPSVEHFKNGKKEQD